MKTRLLVTGATGFVGRQLINQLLKDERYEAVAVVRNSQSDLVEKGNIQIVSNLLADTDWAMALKEIDVVVHLAARVHVMNDTDSDPIEAYRRVNTDATLNLAKQAANAGVKRFVFISSIKVNGESTEEGRAFKAQDIVNPDAPYGRSKFEAEQGLLAIAEKQKMDVVIIRPPLVYGPGVKANFAMMMKWVNRSAPLPLGAVDNQRSLVALDNLVSFIIHCLEHPKAANEIFLISDDEDVSTTQLIQKIAKALQKKTRLVPVPPGLMQFFAKLLGKGDAADRLLGNLQIDSGKVKTMLNWSPVISMDGELKKMAREYTK